MKKHTDIFTCRPITGLMLAAVFGCLSQVQAATDEEKLKALEAEVATPAPTENTATGSTAPRTRAIVFDSPAAEPAKPVAKADCQAKAVNTQAKPFDFTVQFKLGSAELVAESRALLTKIADILGKSPNRCVVVEGHTDITGSASTNLSLSKQRAKSVADFIAGQGKVTRTNLVPVGRGSDEPLKDLEPSDPKNRRVVFKVVS